MEYHSNQIKSIDLIANDTVLTQDALGNMFIEFVKEFKTTHKSYHSQLHANLAQNIFSLTVQLEHVGQYNQDLFNRTISNPEGSLECFEKAICKSFDLKSFQILMQTSTPCIKIRDLNASKSNKIVKIQGIVVSASSIITKPKELYLTCRSCLQSKMVKDAIPRTCEASPKCPIDPYVIVPEKSKVTDIQYAKIQENFEDLPTGETPRHFSILLNGILVNKISPGNQVKITGIFSIKNSEDKSFSYLKVLGIENSKSKTKSSFTEDEENQFKSMAKDDIYENIAKSIAPSIFGNEDIKKTLACMLFGGTRRTREDGITLRGDINVLLFGDPGIAKSQFLKFMELVSPISVYTSGKGSSAAGLTASIIKDKNNEFYLEGGALVLADGGICCIDEFDKMNPLDRIAIHEVMEQQTVTIAKAGIHTTLNARCSVLAAANPILGSYNEKMSVQDNIKLPESLITRFDLIFITLDEYNADKDDRISKHVLKMHISEERSENDISQALFKEFIMYAKSLKPKLSKEAGSLIATEYVKIRESKNSKNLIVNITPRMLETLIRLSTAFAKLRLSETVELNDAKEAIELLNNNLIKKVVKTSSYKKIKLDNEETESPVTLAKSLQTEAFEKIRDLIYDWRTSHLEEQFVDINDLSRDIQIPVSNILSVVNELSDQGIIHLSGDHIFFLE